VVGVTPRSKWQMLVVLRYSYSQFIIACYDYKKKDKKVSEQKKTTLAEARMVGHHP